MMIRCNRQGSNGLWLKGFAMLWCLQAWLAGSAHADGATGITTAAEPSLSDTDAWLEAHLPVLAVSCAICSVPSIEKSWWVKASYSARGCDLTINVINSTVDLLPGDATVYALSFVPATGRSFSIDDYIDKKGTYHGRSVIDFRDISPDGIKITAVVENHDDNIFPIEVAGRLLRFTFDDEDMAHRVKRAFERAITLCGGKPEPF